MKALVLHEWGGPLVPEDRPVPEPGRGEVLVHVAACGVGDTLNNMRNGRNASMPGAALPRIIGHEVSGTVVATGPAVHDVEAGQSVAVYMYLTCGRCGPCRRGDDPLCRALQGHVGLAIDGGLAEHMVVPARNVHVLPDRVSHRDACVAVDAVATPWHALTRVVRLRPVDTLVVIGAGGGVGVHAVQVGSLLGATVIGIDVTDDKLALARAQGAVAAVDGRSDDVVAAVTDLTDGRGADVVVDYVAAASTLHAAFAYLAPMGTLVVQGVNPPGTRLTVEPRALVGREVAVRGSRYASRTEVTEALELVARGAITPVVTRTVPLERTEDLFALIARRELLGRGAVVGSGAAT